MRAVTISAHGGLERIEVRDDLPMPEVNSPTDVRVRVRAAALNRLDLFVLGGLPGVTITPRWIMGADAAGTVDAIGSGVSGVRAGDLVLINPGLSCGACEYCRSDDQPLCTRYGILGEHHPGAFAEYVVVPDRNVRRIPPDSDVEAAAAFTLATLTAWRMVVTRARVGAEDDVLIRGIGGGVALAALQIAKARGAHVWVTSRSAAKLERARGLGADETLDETAGDVGKEIRARTGKRGVTVVIDDVGVATWKSSLGALGRRGRLVTCGATSGPVVETDVRRLYWNQWTIMGSTMGSDTEFTAIADAFAANTLWPPVDSVFPIANARDAFERLQSGEQFGKIVIRVD